MDHWGDHHKYEHKRLKINWFWNRFVSFIIGKLSWQRISYIMLLCQMKKNKVFQTDWTIGSRVTQQYKFVYLNYLGNFKLSGIIVKYWVDPRFCWVLFFFGGGGGVVVLCLVPNVANIVWLSNLDCPFGILYYVLFRSFASYFIYLVAFKWDYVNLQFSQETTFKWF